MAVIYGQEITVGVGSVIMPDGWRFAEKLIPETWDKADFRIPTPHLAPVIESLAVKVEVTGRTYQRKNGEYWVRVRIEYVGDCEPSTFVPGWMKRVW